MNKPLIGLTPSHDLANDDLTMRPTYLRAIIDAGGIPLILPLEAEEDLEQLATSLDGFLFTGGPDLNPLIFGEETHAGCGAISASRDNMELALLNLVMAAHKPILGICRGLQTINVALGGTLYQDLKSQYMKEFPIAHKQNSHYTNYSHKVTVTKDSLLYKILGKDQILVNSMHHQAIKDLAPCLSIDGLSSDQLIEAIHKPDYPYLLAVQWHPEYLWATDQNAYQLFHSFLEACR